MHTFTWKILIALYTLGATPAVYAISGAREAAFFANGDKVSGALKSLVVPVSQAVYPRSVQFAESDLSRARSHLRRVLARVVFAYVVLAAACEAIAGWFVPWFFGADYASGEAAYRVLLLTMPVVAAANILSIQGPVARGEIRRFNLLILTTAMVWIGLALILTPRFGATGMAVACLLAESLKLALLAPELWRTEPVGLTGASRRAEAEE